jgi:hypothetical protein
MAALFKRRKKDIRFRAGFQTVKEGISYNELSKYVGQDYERNRGLNR